VSTVKIPSFPILEVNKFGHDSELFLWDTKKDEVVPSYLYYKPLAEASKCLVWKKKFKKRYTQQTVVTGKLDWYGHPVPAYTIQRTPHFLLSHQPTKIFRDGLAVEVNCSPVKCRAFMWNDFKTTLLKYEPMRMKEHHVFTTRPWVPITEKMIEKFPEDLKVLGCSPSRNAYINEGLTEQEMGVDPLKTLFRTSGSHLHMSFMRYNEASPLPSEEWYRFIALADLLIGVPFVYLFNDELEKKRRKLYGKAGEFRFQSSYGGLEYRVLSSRLWNHQASYSFFTGMWKFVLGGGRYGNMVRAYDPAWIPEIQQCINECDKELAKKLLPQVQLVADAGGAGRLAFIPSGGLPIENVLHAFEKKINEGVIKDARVWSEPFDPDGHTAFSDYMRQWNVQLC